MDDKFIMHQKLESKQVAVSMCYASKIDSGAWIPEESTLVQFCQTVGDGW